VGVSPEPQAEMSMLAITKTAASIQNFRNFIADVLLISFQLACFAGQESHYATF
jgi:hypothetical protein